jgi:hypothetical protein
VARHGRRPLHVPARLGDRPAAVDLAHLRRRSALRLQSHHVGLFLGDLLKASSLSLLLGGPLVFVILFLMQRAGSLWWLYAWIVWVAFTF